MEIRGKKGLSPVIATVLLIAIALVLAAIIFLWVRGFAGEQAQKLDEPVANWCDDINFDAEVFEDRIVLANRGNVPLYQVQIRTVGSGTVETFQTVTGATVSNGDTDSVDLSDYPLDSDETPEVEIVPVILGEKESGKETYPCSESSITRTVQPSVS